MGKYFGTDGFRGEANIKLTADQAYKIGRFVGWHYGQTKRARVIIGKDTRCSGDMFEYSLIAGLTASGADAYLLHVTTTPSISYLIRSEGFDCGVMISASHNPYYDNGIKLINSDGKKIESEIEEKIEAYIDDEIKDIPFAVRENTGRVIDYEEGRKKYLDHIAGSLNCKIPQLKIGIDCANGSASALAPELFDRIGVQSTVINNTPDGININNGCGSTHPETLQKLVREKKLDAGFAFDGDADRCLAVDEEGNVIDGDVIMFVCGKYLKENKRLHEDTVVTTVMSNIGLYKAFEREGIRSEITDVGDKYVSERMTAGDFSLGGEQSGHIIFSEFASTGDGMLTAVMVLEAIANKNKTLKELASEVDIYPQLLKNIRVKDKTVTLENENVKKAVKEAEELLADDGRILVRMSGTEPLIRVMVEAQTDEICAKYVNQVIEVIKAEGLEE